MRRVEGQRTEVGEEQQDILLYLVHNVYCRIERAMANVRRVESTCAGKTLSALGLDVMSSTAQRQPSRNQTVNT
jgi:hypothetical protein